MARLDHKMILMNHKCLKSCGVRNLNEFSLFRFYISVNSFDIISYFQAFVNDRSSGEAEGKSPAPQHTVH